MYPEIASFVEGRWHGESQSRIDVLNPATSEVIGSVPLADQALLDQALAAAAAGFDTWRKVSAYDRCTLMRRAAALLRQRAGAIGRILTIEQGKPLREAEREVAGSADTLDFLAEEARRSYGRIVPPRTPGAVEQTVRREPVGPVLAITPWNYPADLPSRKIGGALAAGCSVILKAAEETPATAVEIVKCFVEVGLPEGVLQLVFGEPAFVSEYLIASPVIRKVSFTGSVAVGKHLAGLCARRMIRFTPELGGHAPVIVLDDADIAKTAKAIVASKFCRNAGQVCASPTRLLVQRRAYDEFRSVFLAETGRIVIGDGLDAATQMGPVAHSRRLDALSGLVEDARTHAAEVLAGGAVLQRPGFFFAPTVIEARTDEPAVMRVEPFGPIATLTAVDDVNDALRWANGTGYGLAAYAFTRDIGRVNAVLAGLEAGLVGINTFSISMPELPFGGVKDSGYGLEKGPEGLEAYTVVKTAAVAFA
jgi:succinate-semialdehyde dehydrogenase/glutarate-semialdehyde dehydrogenase